MWQKRRGGKGVREGEVVHSANPPPQSASFHPLEKSLPLSLSTSFLSVSLQLCSAEHHLHTASAFTSAEEGERRGRWLRAPEHKKPQECVCTRQRSASLYSSYRRAKERTETGKRRLRWSNAVPVVPTGDRVIHWHCWSWWLWQKASRRRQRSGKADRILPRGQHFTSENEAWRQQKRTQRDTLTNTRVEKGQPDTHRI